MSDTGKRDALERALEAMTTSADARSGELWARALESQGRAAGATGMSRLERPLPRWVVGSCVVALLVLVIGAALLPSLGRARQSVRGPAAEAVASRAAVDKAAGRSYGVPPGAAASPAAPPAPLLAAPTDAGAPGPQAARVGGGTGNAAASVDAPEPVRAVVKKARVGVRVEDVRAAFEQVQALASEAGGEFVADAQLTGEAERAVASLTLRVRAERLEQTLAAIRSMGEVVEESATAEDVTDQVVDLDARLSNERRVEAELLELLDKRADAPLKDVLELRTSIAGVRQSIERLTAQRDRLGRLVALSSVSVRIEHESAARRWGASGPETSLADRFVRSMARAWRGALEFLIDSVALVVGIAVGGALIWAIAAVVGVWAWRAAKRRRERAAEEPPPRLD